MKEKRLTDSSEIIKLCRQELYENKVKKYVDAIIDMQGCMGIVYQLLEEMYYHGKLKYPNTYKYRKELSRYYKEYVRQQSKRWESKK